MDKLIETSLSCPYCGEHISVTVELLDEAQQYIEDCQVCCRPITINVGSGFDDYPAVSAHAENDTY